MAIEIAQANEKEEKKRKAEPGYLQLGECPYNEHIPENLLGPVLNERFKKAKIINNG